MMFAVPAEPYEVGSVVGSALEQLLIMHADHEQNLSTATVRNAGSGQANLYACISAGMSALWGPLHGGANESVIKTLERIAADGGDVAKWVGKAKDPEDRFKLPGFGHPVYRNFDPRAKLIKATADRVLAALGADGELFDIAKRLEETALQRRLLHRAPAVPQRRLLFGPHLPSHRLPEEHVHRAVRHGPAPGWIAQWKEMIEDPETKIARPRQVYTGVAARDYVPIESR